MNLSLIYIALTSIIFLKIFDKYACCDNIHEKVGL